MTKYLLTMLLLACSIGPAWGATATVNVILDEPTTNADATPLTDLASLHIVMKDPGGLQVGSVSIPASSVNGGQQRTGQIALANVPDAAITRYDVEATAVDVWGNVSAPAVSFVDINTNDTTPPAAPGIVNITVTVVITLP